MVINVFDLLDVLSDILTAINNVMVISKKTSGI